MIDSRKPSGGRTGHGEELPCALQFSESAVESASRWCRGRVVDDFRTRGREKLACRRCLSPLHRLLHSLLLHALAHHTVRIRVMLLRIAGDLLHRQAGNALCLGNGTILVRHE